MDAQVIAVTVWIAIGGAGLAAGVAGLASTRRRIQGEVVMAAPSVLTPDESPVGAH